MFHSLIIAQYSKKKKKKLYAIERFVLFVYIEIALYNKYIYL